MREEDKKLAEELLFGQQKPLGFAKQLFMGRADSSLLSPFPSLENEEEKAFLQDAQQFVEKEIDPVQIDREAEIPPSLLEKMGKKGLLGITVPKEYGGLGFSQELFCRVAEMVAARCSSTALFLNAHLSIGVRALVLFGTEKQKETWLPSLARGEKFAAFSLTEPNAGSDAAGIETRAVLDRERGVYRITGQKQWTTNGSLADVLTVMAKTEDGKVTAFLVTPDREGFQVVDAALEKVGMRGTKTSNLRFDSMEVPVENVLGPVGGGLRVCLTVLDFGRTTFGATCTGAAKELMQRALTHAKERHQFQRPLASFPMVKKKIAAIASLTYAMEATTYVTAGLIDRGVEDFLLEAAILKVFNSESLWTIVYETMQILGGRSFFIDAPYERMMRDARLNMIGEGANEVLRVFIGLVGMRGVGEQLKEGKEALLSPSKLAPFLREMGQRLSTPSLGPCLSSLVEEKRQLEKGIARFSRAVLRLLAYYREEIVEKQLIVNRIANCALAFYTASAVLSRVGACSPSSVELATAQHYLRSAIRLVERSLLTLSSSRDQEIEIFSDLLMEEV